MNLSDLANVLEKVRKELFWLNSVNDLNLVQARLEELERVVAAAVSSLRRNAK